MTERDLHGCALAAALLLAVAAPGPVAAAPGECVIVLHGLARVASSMQPVVDVLAADYAVVNVDYPSRQQPIAALAPLAVESGIRRCRASGARQLHFVTHSLGGILVRVYLATHVLADLGRVVMLAPPNQGSEVVDHLRDTPGFAAFNGPAVLELGTDAASVPRHLGAARFEVGVVAGTRSPSPWSGYLPGPNDGTVTVASTRLTGMRDFLALPVTHTFIMRDAAVLAAVRAFLRDGRFSAPARP